MRQWISGAKIVVGDGQTPAFEGDVLIEDGRIARMGHLAISERKTADQVLEAKGKVLAPGFVDTHNHGALAGTLPGGQGVPVACELALRAGVTKRICGVDGLSPAPVVAATRDQYAAQLRPLDGDVGAFSWTDLNSFYAWHRGRAITDMGMYLGHSAVRMAVMGNAPRAASGEELRAMQALVQAEAPHCLGLSTGLVYNPAVYSSQAEITALLRAFGEVAPAALFPHLRSESDRILPSLDECLNACIEAGSAYCNEHTKIAGKRNYDKIGALEAKLADGASLVRTMANMYPYTAGSTTGDALFPPSYRAGSRTEFLGRLQDPQARAHLYEMIVGDTTSWDNFIGFCDGLDGIAIAGCPDPDLVGKRLGEVARRAGAVDLGSREAYEAVFDFFVKHKLEITIISHYGSELLMERFFRRDDMAICTDGLMPGPGQRPHPRSLGTFPKALRMARELDLGLERMIYRLAALPCDFLGLDSPVLREGGDASMVLFDWEQVREQNSYEEPMLQPVGIHQVWVHGQLAFDEGRFPLQFNYPGRILARSARA